VLTSAISAVCPGGVSPAVVKRIVGSASEELGEEDHRVPILDAT
jgi:hypothetical protein